jgi:hypothetical protein
MCIENAREHRFRVCYKLANFGREGTVVVYATGLAQAVAKADGWIAREFPGVSVEISCMRTGYTSRANAAEHGAIFPTE